ncbi:hypothetical protein LSTR_LSTR014060 [Laodelphax striatellus]|uniref:39S ribosomal protein L41, mitochondrial n=1 Tax=Laodelphax striatellus TaxID=195883 RepID=A0A482XGY2_LAOST|nr:hypothetical protein LSTR_LSTR014060 [Laodelphax striatellus]
MFSTKIASCRKFSTCTVDYGKRNFRKFLLHNRGPQNHKERQKTNPLPDMLPYDYGVRSTGYMEGDKFVEVPELIPEIIVPDLTDCDLKPYVSYRVSTIDQPEWTARDLFNAVYRSKIENDFNTGKLNADGSAVEPSAEEKLTAEEARIKARQTGCDIYIPKSKGEQEEMFDDYLK